jgi:peptide/nickel transport system permease protein
VSTPAVALGSQASLEKGEAARWRFTRRALRNGSVLIGGALVLLVVAIAVIGPFAWSANPTNEAFQRLLPPSWSHPMGTDSLGRDEFARFIYGAQVSLEVSGAAVAISAVLGLLIGVSAGMYRKIFDPVLMRIVDMLFAFPGLVLAILIAGLLGPNQTTATVTIGVVYAPALARVARGATLSVVSSPFVESSRALGASPLRVIRKDILPNIAAPMITVTVTYISSAILLEAGLSFLGLGIQPPAASWGNMINDAQTYMQLAWWLAVFPGLGIAVAVLGFNFLGDGLRDLADPRSAG